MRTAERFFRICALPEMIAYFVLPFSRQQGASYRADERDWTQRPFQQRNVPQRSARSICGFGRFGAETTSGENQNRKTGPWGLSRQLSRQRGDSAILQNFFGHDRGARVIANCCSELLKGLECAHVNGGLA